MKTISIYIDLIIDIYNISNPILIYDKIQEEFNIDISIHQISDYIAIYRKEIYNTIVHNKYEFAN